MKNSTRNEDHIKKVGPDREVGLVGKFHLKLNKNGAQFVHKRKLGNPQIIHLANMSDPYKRSNDFTSQSN